MTRASTLPPSGTVGLLGGAFDPPHYGHLMVAHEALAQLALCKLFVVVTRAAPHKEVETDAAIRLGLAEIAFSGLDAVEVSRTELDRPGPSYTVDTVRWSRRRYGETTFVIGADEFADFLEWHEPEGVLDAAHLAVATRPGFPLASLEPVLTRLRGAERVHFFSIPELPISSREIRELVWQGRRISELVPCGVAAEIRQRRLYRNPREDERVPSDAMNPTCEGF